jgi:DNA recombination protein RmuC
MQAEPYWVAVLIALVVGVAAGWLLSSLRQKTRTDAAVATAQAAKDIELATLYERLRIGDSQLQSSIDRAKQSEAEARRLGDEIDEASNEIARLSERAARVVALEAELQSYRQLHQSTDAALANLRESTAGDLNRLRAELTSQADVAANLLKERDEARMSLRTAETALGDLRQDNGRMAAELEATATTTNQLRGEREHLAAELAGTREAFNRISQEVVDLKARAEKDRESFDSQLQLLLDAKASLTEQFKALASDILEEKSKRFAEQNQSSLTTLLEPLRQKLGEFQGKVEEVYVQEGKDRSALQEQVRNLVTLNKALSEDAKNLTQALRGSSKTQGGWGEVVLERVLELSGLRKGVEYIAQEAQTREDGSRAMPDVVIHLPEDRRLVVDAKVSLVAYERFTSAADDSERSTAARAHLDSVRSHIRSLSEKRYQDLYGIKSPDFVLAFIPIEPAFMLAVTHDTNLFQEAWERNVLLVSPSTLLFVVRTVAQLWRQEAQTRNAQEIAKRGGELYDKLVGFVGDLQSIGARLKQAREAYDAAEAKLTTGRGNVIRQAEMLRSLGVKPGKALPTALIALTQDQEESTDEGGCAAGASTPPSPE